MAYKTPKHIQEKKDAKKHHILDTALKLFALKGFENTSIQDICQAAEVSVGSMYFYFPSKEHIYEEVYSRINNESLQHLERAIDGAANLEEIIQKVIETIVLSALPDRTEAQFFLANRTMSNLKIKRDDSLQKFARWFKTVLDEAVENGEFNPQNTELAAVSFIYGTYQSVRYWNVFQLETSPEEMIDTLYTYHSKGLGLENCTQK
ncbi:TetR/AcrR family transcriptional regulator [Desulfitobacterium sp. PCE1]|uniref:TetR/AcrR family transcriptional regulator n=1 Tax=Desulfitobacterium sp. PCE1 TaxID=146907 RepID=UPI00036C4C40|nr:TetR/AcrR family transcriptional regulator [Desulfitobacterium sp. PCE1]